MNFMFSEQTLSTCFQIFADFGFCKARFYQSAEAAKTADATAKLSVSVVL